MAFPLTEGITRKGWRSYIYLHSSQDFSHTLKMIYWMGKAGIVRDGETEEERLGNKVRVEYEVGLCDS